MSTAPGTGSGAAPRRRGASETTEAIARAAVSLVLEHGYDQVTVDMIADAAGVSQRTFFNHFATKEAALLGPDLPRIDERAARRFIVSDGPLLAEAVGLIRIEPSQLPGSPQAMAERIQAASTHPALLARQMERLGAIEEELREIIALRLHHHATDAAGEKPSEEELDEQAELITHMLAGVMRFVGIRWAKRAAAGGAPESPDSPEFQRTLAAALRRLG